jgi:hypothetical protein
MADRGLRRAQKLRQKERTRRFMRTWPALDRPLADDPKFVGRLARTPHPCSSPGCCGNPRRLGHRTPAELAPEPAE